MKTLTFSSFFRGENIRQSHSEQLNACSENDLVNYLQSEELKKKIDKIRNISNISKDAQANLKKQLPYFIGAKFENNLRKGEFFKEIYYCIIDLDHIGNKEEVEQLKIKLKNDSKLLLAFVSPSGTGLKLVYRLNSIIDSSKKFSDFYKSFTYGLGKTYPISQFIDYKTFDATRVSFLSYDSNLYYNPNAHGVDWKRYISLLDLFNIKDAQTIKPEQNTAIDSFPEDKKKESIDMEKTYADITKTLNPKANIPKKEVLVPAVLRTLVKYLEKKIKQYNLVLQETKDISYGQKIKIVDGQKFAFFNVFYGKKGFSIVATPVRNSCKELMEVSVKICNECIYEFNSANYDGLTKPDFENYTVN